MSLKRFDAKNGAELLANFKIVKIALNSKHGLSKEIAEPAFVEKQNVGVAPTPAVNTPSEVINPAALNTAVQEPVMSSIAVEPVAEPIMEKAPVAEPVMNETPSMSGFDMPKIIPTSMDTSMLQNNFVPEEKAEEKQLVDDSGQSLDVPGDADKNTGIIINKSEEMEEEKPEDKAAKAISEMVQYAIAAELEKLEASRSSEIRALREEIEALKSTMTPGLNKINTAVEAGMNNVIDATARFTQQPQTQAPTPTTVNVVPEQQPYIPSQRVA
jgi:hypothetical protein